MNLYALLFPGQGSQYVGMGQKFSSDTSFRKTIDKALEILGPDYRRVLESGPESELVQTHFTQPLTLAVSYALFEMLQKQYLLKPYVLAGHSLGEITALTVAGAIQFEDALKIVETRGQLMAKSQPGGMAAIIGLDVDTVIDLCERLTKDEEKLFVANFNSEQQTIIAGTQAALESAQQSCSELHVRFVRLNVSAPFHTPFMNEASVAFENTLLKYRFKPLLYPVLSNVDAQFYSDETEIPFRLAQQMVSPVQWKASMDRLIEHGIGTCMEIGPKNILKGLFQQHRQSIQVYSIDVTEDQDTIRHFLSNTRHTVEICLKHIVTTKNNDSSSILWQEAVERPYRNLLNRYYELVETKISPDRSMVEEAIQLVEKTFEIKKTPIEQREARWIEISATIRDRVTMKTVENQFASHIIKSKKVSLHGE